MQRWAGDCGTAAGEREEECGEPDGEGGEPAGGEECSPALQQTGAQAKGVGIHHSQGEIIIAFSPVASKENDEAVAWKI